MFKKIIKNLKEPEPKEKDFEIRYPLQKISFPEKKEKLQKTFLAQGEKNLELMRKVPNRSKNLAYFEEISKFSQTPLEKGSLTGQREKEIEGFKKAGGKVIGYFCNFVPEELIYAVGGLPIRLCSGFYESIEPAEEILAKDICPLIKSSFGCKLAKLPYFSLCDLVILPTGCDGKKKLGEILSDWLPVWILEVPNIKDRKQSQDLWLREIKALKKRLEKLTGQKITFSRLKRAIKNIHQRQLVFRQLYEVRKAEKPVISGRDALLVLQTSFFDEPKRWTEKTKKLVQELKEKNQKGQSITGPEICRLLLTGSPIVWPNYKLLNIIEEFGGIVVGDTLCSGTQHLYNLVEIDEWQMKEMLKAIAERYLLPSICPCFVGSEDRIDNLLQTIKDFKIEGVVYHQLRLCQLYDLEFQKVKQVLAKENVPLLRIQTDYSQEDIEQIKTRVEAFLEMLKVRR